MPQVQHHAADPRQHAKPRGEQVRAAKPRAFAAGGRCCPLHGGKEVVKRARKDGAPRPPIPRADPYQLAPGFGVQQHHVGAGAEHVDNALQWGATEVRVYFRQTGKQGKQRIDAPVYDNGRGMAPHVLKVAMAFGGSMVYDNRGGIGRYGMGMKAAALNNAPSVDVYSLQEPGAFELDDARRGRDRQGPEQHDRAAGPGIVGRPPV